MQLEVTERQGKWSWALHGGPTSLWPKGRRLGEGHGFATEAAARKDAMLQPGMRQAFKDKRLKVG